MAKTRSDQARTKSRRAARRYWSQQVTESSNALDLEAGVFAPAIRAESPAH